MAIDTAPRRLRARPPLGNRRALVFLAIALAPGVAMTLAAGAINAYVDPLWVLPKLGEPSFHYCVKDDRQNKINRLLHGHIRVQSVLLGSSRSAFMDPADFVGSSVVNLSVDGLMPAEYPELARMFHENVGDPHMLYAAFDFSRYAATREANDLLITRLREREALSRSSLYPLRQLLDPQVMTYSIDTLRHCNSPDNPGTVFYRYDGVRLAKRVTDEVRQQTIQSEIERLNYSDASFLVDPDFDAHLDNLKRAAPNSAFVVWVTPVTIDLLMKQVMSGRLPNYFDWIEHLLDAFGAVYHFNGINELTRKEENFFDSHHIYGDVAARLAAILEQRESATADGFGERITKDTFPRFREAFRTAVCKELSIRMPRRPGPVAGCPDIVPVAPNPPAKDGPAATPMAEPNPFVPFSLRIAATDANWTASTQETHIQVRDGQILLRGSKSKWQYQLQSSPIATTAGRSYVLKWEVDVFYGEMGVGIIDDIGGGFAVTQPIHRGPQRIVFIAPSNRIRVILFNNNDVDQTTLSIVRALTVSEPTTSGGIR